MKTTAPTAPTRATKKTASRLAMRALCLGLFAIAASVPAAAQDETPPPGEKPVEKTPVPVPVPEGGEPAGKDEIAEIIRQIEGHMTEAERLLTGLDSGETAGAEQEAAAELLKKLLDQAGKQQSSALSSIDKLLEIAAKQSQQQQQKGGKSGQKRSESDQKREQEERERRERERLSRKENQPESGKEPEGQSEDEKNGRKKPPPAGSEHAKHGNQFDKWGALPPALRARIEQGNWEGFPPEYREKLEKWYKRIAAEEK